MRERIKFSLIKIKNQSLGYTELSLSKHCPNNLNIFIRSLFNTDEYRRNKKNPLKSGANVVAND